MTGMLNLPPLGGIGRVSGYTKDERDGSQKGAGVMPVPPWPVGVIKGKKAVGLEKERCSPVTSASPSFSKKISPRATSPHIIKEGKLRMMI